MVLIDKIRFTVWSSREGVAVYKKKLERAPKRCFIQTFLWAKCYEREGSMFVCFQPI